MASSVPTTVSRLRAAVSFRPPAPPPPPPPLASRVSSVAVSRRPSACVAAAARRRYPMAAVAGSSSPATAAPEAEKAFVDEMRAVAMRLHTRDQAKEGEKEADAPPVAQWEPSVAGYLRFLVDSRLVYATLDGIVARASVPWYAEFRNTGLERTEQLTKDLEWFRQQGHAIPEPSAPGINYAKYLEELSTSDPQAFICHFYNIYFAHTAGGRFIGKKVAEKILNNKELEFYRWEGKLQHLLQGVRDKINKVASTWSREEKDRCLEETEKSFSSSGEILRHIFT